MPPAPLRVVKVPHHGSLTSSTRGVRASRSRRSVAVVSAGRSNHFGHPVPEVLERYRDVGAEIFRTDRDGAVTVDTDGTFDRRAARSRADTFIDAPVTTKTRRARRHEEQSMLRMLNSTLPDELETL